jgi:glycosyltransferase involved in cell wall biosynthesis
MSQVAFSWNGLPQYAARLIAAAIRTHGSACAVVGSRPTVPVRGVEQALGQPVHWVDAGQPTSWKGLGLQVPRVFFQSGWAYPAFNALGDEVRAAGGQVCLLMDNSWRGDFRQWLGAAWYRLCQRRKFAAILVPGKSGRRLARWYGMPDDCIWEGMYGADPAIFFNGPPLAERPKRIIFVGQYIHRKQCLPLAQAFAAVADRIPGWELEMYGSGPQQELIPSHPRLRVNGFVQPEQLGALYREARIFALPSLSEAWGLVVHEAALSGCQLLLSDAIGARADFVGLHNAALFRAGDVGSLQDALMRLASQDEETLMNAQAESIRLAQSHGPETFARRTQEIIVKLTSSMLP